MLIFLFLMQCGMRDGFIPYGNVQKSQNSLKASVSFFSQVDPSLCSQTPP